MQVLPPILIAEDEEADIFFLRRAARKAGVQNPLIVVQDGQQAIDYLKDTDQQPGLVMLDLKMPRLSGFDVLEWLGTQPRFKQTPIVVLSSSADPGDMARALELGARDFITKPPNALDLERIVTGVHRRWCGSPADKASEA